MALRLTSPQTRAPVMPIYPAVRDGLQGLWTFGSTLDRSKRNHWYGGAGDLISPSVAPTVGTNYCRFVDGTSYFETAAYDTGQIGICIIARSVSDTAASLVATSRTTTLGDYGFNLYIASASQIRFRRECNNSGSAYTSQPQITTRDVSEWTAYWAGNNASLAYLKDLTTPTNSQASIVGTPSTAPYVIRIGADYASGTTGTADIAALAIYSRWPSDAERTAVSTQLLAQVADVGIVPA